MKSLTAEYGWQGGLVRDTMGVTQLQLAKKRLREVERGSRTLATFRAIPLVFRAENLILGAATSDARFDYMQIR